MKELSNYGPQGMSNTLFAVLTVLGIVGDYFRIEGVDLGLAVAVFILLLAGVSAEKRSYGFHMTLADWGVLGIVAIEAVSLVVSPYPANGFWRLHMLAVCVLLGFLVRLGLRSDSRTAMVAALIGLFGAYLAWSGWSQFGSRVEEFRAAGLTAIVPLRARLITPPAPYVLGEWLTLLFLTLPFATAAAGYLWAIRRPRWAAVSLAVPLGITCTICLACSRALFWSTVLFFVAVAAFAVHYRLMRLKAALVFLAASLGVLGLVLAIENAMYPGIVAAYFGRNVSQARSVEGRLAIWKRSMSTFQRHPWMGVGAANAPLFLSGGASEEETTGFASRTFSLPVQILTEGGLVGFGCWVALLVVIALQFHRGMSGTGLSPPRKVMCVCLASGLIAVLFRELTYSSLLEHSATAMLALTAVAMISQPEAKGPRHAKSWRIADLRPWAAMLAVAVVILHFIVGSHEKSEDRLREFYSKILSADFEGAEKAIDEAIRLWPGNARYYAWRAYCRSQAAVSVAVNEITAPGRSSNFPTHFRMFPCHLTTSTPSS